MGIEEPRTRIAHLLRRAGFGGTEEEIDRYAALGFDRAVADLLDLTRPDPAAADADAQGFDLNLPDGLRSWWLFRMLHTTRPLQEKLALFWHGHFATSLVKVRDPLLMRWQNDLFREHGLGSYRTLLQKVSRDPAMLRWLDSNTNRKASPNENFARELLELFTLGIGTYSEDDVKAAARAYTGWFMDPATFAFRFAPQAHDAGPKSFLGRSGPLDGDDVVEAILAHPVAARHVARRLFRFFVHDDPDPETVERFAAVLRGANYELRPLVEALLRSPDFSSPRAYHAKVKGPVELVVGAIRQLGATTAYSDLFVPLRRMGQDLFAPPNVKGWDGGLAWVSTSTLLERYNFANRLCTAREDTTRTTFDPLPALSAAGLTTAEAVADRYLRLLVDGDVPPEVRAALVAYLNDGGPFDLAAHGDIKVRGLVHLIMATPIYQSA